MSVTAAAHTRQDLISSQSILIIFHSILILFSFPLAPCPSVQVEVITPEDHMGDVIGDLNSRRGQINSFGDKPGGMKVRGRQRGREGGTD